MAKQNVEDIKAASHGLRGTIKKSLASTETHFEEHDYQLLKFHGTYQQDDRDQRTERRKQKLDKAWEFMVRTKQPGGVISADQYLALDRLCDDIANGTLRITTRQGIQFHGIPKVGLKDAISRINASGLTTWGACGDVVRNTMAPAAPYATPAHRDAQQLARELSETFLARTTAYTEIWLNGEKLDTETSAGNELEEPIYGRHYLPRKFKIGIAVPPQNDVDVYSQDIGFIPHAPDGEVEGYTLTAGGGFGMSHGKTETYPVLGKPLFYVQREHALDAAVAIVCTQRDYGNREDRKRARLKYLIETRGLDWFRKEVESRMKTRPEPPKPVHFDTVGDHLGWREQGDGKLFCGIRVEVGRILDTESCRYRTAFRTIAEKFSFPIRFTPNCNIIFADIEPGQRDAVSRALGEHGVNPDESLTEARRTAHACVALPTCGLALSESERVFPALMNRIDEILRDLGLENEPILFRMTGCPNGCARPYNADFAFVGRSPGKYAFYVGGSVAGDRLAGLEQKTIAFDDIPSAVRRHLEEFARDRQPGETFSQFWGRTHKNGDIPHPEQFHVELSERARRLGQA